jgi:pyruvate dehydrogenase E2 component (dihydrolipoamide acetyltransferase)
MAFNIYEFKFPDVGEGITEGKLVDWKIGVGDNIKVDQPICSVETDKAVVDIPSPVTGKVVELLNKVDDTLIVGNVIVTVDVGNDEITIPESNKEHQKQVEKIKEIKPNEKEISNGEKSYKIEGLSEIGKPKTEEKLERQVSNEVSKPHNIQVETSNNSKAMLSVRKFAKEKNIDLTTIKATGNHGQILIGDLTGSSVKQNIENKTEKEDTSKEPNYSQDTSNTNNIQIIDKLINSENKPEKEILESNGVEKHTINNNGHKFSEHQDNIRDVIASPNVRQIALQKGIDITAISGSGENGRINLEDLEPKSGPITDETKEIKIPSDVSKVEPIKTLKADTVQKEQIKPQYNSKETIENTNLEDHHLNQTKESLTLPRDIPMPYDNVRQIIADKMVDSLQKTAQLTIFNKICIDELVELREKEKEILAQKGVKLTYLPFFIKAFIAAAKEYPTFNGISTENSTIIKSDFNIGIAMDTPRGLLVPNVFKAQSKSIVQIANDISALIEKGKNSKITIEDMSNGSFTITSLGAKGGQFFTPILNYPQTAILGIGEISKQPIIKNEQIVIGNVLHLSLTFDHRSVDGAEAAKFFNRLCELLKNVDLLLMEA